MDISGVMSKRSPLLYSYTLSGVANKALRILELSRQANKALADPSKLPLTIGIVLDAAATLVV